ncbi:MAG: diguanylate cyclase [Clostridiales bacterium 43-6]|nr:MAG: diguanylate cyclase [Clostridiales bacterium 43-6]
MTEKESHVALLKDIIENKAITTVFQPIISLKDGTIYGYEALSRGPAGSSMHNPEMMFQTAREHGCLWDLELVCRTCALESAYQSKNDLKLFLNVNTNIIHDEKFMSGFTKEYIRQFDIDAENIIFEITEKNAIEDMYGFKKTIEHYKNQSYKIAIDDAGAGYSGLNLITDIKPHYIKLDMKLIRDIDKDGIKYSLVKSLYEFSKLANIHLIAEGIETYDELSSLIHIGIHYGQGFFIQPPHGQIKPISEEVINGIVELNSKKYSLYGSHISNLYIGNLANQTKTVNPRVLSDIVYDMFLHNDSLSGICITENDKVLGVITKQDIFSKMSGLYGFNLYQRKPIFSLMQAEFLTVDYKTPIDVVSRLAMSRAEDKLYDFITVTKNEKFYGIVTVKNLLEKTIELEVINAKHQNPLSGLPGNLIIEQYLTNYLSSCEELCALYFDIDNFKSYNDVYGFENGDNIIKLLSNTIQCHIDSDAFIGHIGGDDFIAIIKQESIESICSDIICEFDTEIRKYYNQYDLAKGYITAKNRHGQPENFPIISLSIAAITKAHSEITDMNEFSVHVGEMKRKCKQIPGSVFLLT